MSSMKILLACESSGALRSVLRSRGHDAISCDLSPAEDDSPHHIQDDLRSVLRSQWDAIIAFPPCTYLCKAQEHRVKKSLEREVLQRQAVEFVEMIWNHPCPLVSIENPVGHLNTRWRKPTQIVYPWWFGDSYRKEICLWLRGFPPLIATYYHPVRRSINNHTNGRMSQEQKSRIKSSWKYYPGMITAIADQWNDVLSPGRPLVSCPPEREDLPFGTIHY